MIVDDILKIAKWKNQDSFPSCDTWKNECGKWLVYLHKKNWFNRYFSRITKGNSKERDETFAEISSAYFLEEKLDFQITELEPNGVYGHKGDFSLSIDGKDIFCEVKSPGWEAEIVKNNGPNSPRLKLPKYINGEARWVDNSMAIIDAVQKAYIQIPDNKYSIVIINDDLPVNIFDEVRVNRKVPQCVHYALYYEPLKPPYKDNRLEGCFVRDKYKNLSGVLFFRVFLKCKYDDVQYENILCLNKNASFPLPRNFLERFNVISE